MNLLSPVTEIMSTNLYTLSSNSSIAEVGKLFGDHKIHHIPIVDDGELVGIVSKSDYLFFRRGFLDNEVDEQKEEIRMNNYQVTYIMTTGIATMDPSDRINVALEVFKENIFHAIPVVAEKELVGIITTYDIIKHLAENAQAFAKY